MGTVIIGAGVFGLCTARHLLRSGVSPSDILLVEQETAGAGATGLSAGLISVQVWDATDVTLIRRSQDIFREVAAASAGGFTYHRTGMFTVVREGDDVRWLSKMAQLCRQNGAAVEILSADSLAKRAPGLRTDDISAAAFAPEDGHGVPADFASSLAAQLREAGLRLHATSRVETIRRSGGQVAGVSVRAAGGTVDVRADRVVLAAGPWSKALLRRSGLDAPLAPYRTQIGLIRMEGAGSVPTVHDAVSDVYFRSESATQVLIGDGTEDRESDPEAYNTANDASFREHVARALLHRLPGSRAGGFAGGWAGLVVGTPDRHPLLGPHWACDGLVLAAGDNGFGFMRGPAIGEAVGTCVLDGKLPPTVRRFATDRFAEWDGSPFPIRQGFSRTGAVHGDS